MSTWDGSQYRWVGAEPPVWAGEGPDAGRVYAGERGRPVTIAAVGTVANAERVVEAFTVASAALGATWEDADVVDAVRIALPDLRDGVG